MKQYYINKNSDKLILFFSGWGCDEFEFLHLESDSDVLILYEYFDTNLNFDFSKYKEINLLAFSAGVFMASIYPFDFKINKKIAISGNPYLFDEHYGLSSKMLETFRQINEENCDDFARNYLVKTDEEYNNFHPSKRTLESCNLELEALEKIYKENSKNIKDIFDRAYIGDDDPIFKLSAQKEFYKDRIIMMKNSRHNPFFRIKSYEDFLR